MPRAEWKLTRCKMEICATAREPALRFSSFILQTELLRGSNRRPAPAAQGSTQSCTPIALERCCMEKEKQTNKVGRWRVEKDLERLKRESVDRRTG